MPLQPPPNFTSFPNVRAKYLLPCITSSIYSQFPFPFSGQIIILPLQPTQNFLSFPNVRAKYFSPCISPQFIRHFHSHLSGQIIICPYNHPKISYHFRMYGRNIFRPVFHSQNLFAISIPLFWANNYLPRKPTPNFLSFPNVRAKNISPLYHNPVSFIRAK